MRVTDLEIGQFCTRDNWGHRSSRGHLCIRRVSENVYEYWERGVMSSKVRQYSSAYTHKDFVLCDEFAVKITKKEIKMKYEEVEVVVVNNRDGGAKTFASEQDALEYIANDMEANPRTKYKMLKPYQKVEPKAVDLSDLITKV